MKSVSLKIANTSCVAKIAISLFLALALGLGLAGCASNSGTSNSNSNSSSSTEKANNPTESNPIVVDKDKKEVKYLAEVNGIYFTENTRHGIVFKDGSNGDKSVLRGLGDEKEFYKAMVDLGFNEGNNLTANDMSAPEGQGKSIEGQKLDITIEWDGQSAMPIEKCFKPTTGNAKTADWRFGGNIERANKNNTGCVLCLDSCATGICSDASWVSNTTANNVTWFNGVEDVLPADGTKVIVTFKAKN